VAFVHVLPVAESRAQTPSPFSPALSDPKNLQSFRPPSSGSSSGTWAETKAIPSNIVPPSGAGDTGFDSTGSRGKKKKKKPLAGEPHPLPPPPPPQNGAPQLAAGHGVPQQLKERNTYAEAYKTTDSTPRRPPIPAQDPYAPLGLRVGSFVVNPSLEINRGYDTNPAHFPGGVASGFTELTPTLKVKSDWSRHEVGLDLRGSYSEYDKVSSLNRPLLDAKAHSRVDVSHDTTVTTETRYYLSTDYPGSPNLPVGFAKLPIFNTYGSTLGVTQRFNRLELSVKGAADRTQYQPTALLDGSSSSNTDRDLNQYSGAVRAAYEIFPGVKPFAEVGGDVRKHDLQFDRDGFERDSHAVVPRVGTTINLPQRLTGEISVGYMFRKFEDPDLAPLNGVVADASLIWAATGLTTVTLTATSRAEETVLSGVSGALRRDVGVQVDHALRRWLIWSVRAGYGIDTYKSIPCECNGFLERVDNRASLGTLITYKMSRELALKGEYRYDQLHSNSAGVNYNANVFLIGLQLQR
jgi:hypothetical protein